MRGKLRPRFACTTWADSAAFQQACQAGTFSVPDTDAFHAQWREISIHGLRVGELSTSPISGSFGIPDLAPATVLLVIEEGSLQYTVHGRTVMADPGSLHHGHR